MLLKLFLKKCIDYRTHTGVSLGGGLGAHPPGPHPAKAFLFNNIVSLGLICDLTLKKRKNFTKVNQK